MSRLELRGSTVLITGGGAGIGLALAQECASRGARCALLDINADAAAAAAARLGGGALARAVDVTDLEALEQACGEIAEETGGIDVLVANAGIGPVSTTVDAGDREHQRRVLDVNLHGVWHTLWAGVPHVVARQGHVVVISSVAAFIPAPAWAAYGASKAAVEALARAQRIELAPTGTTVGVAHFGLIDTALVEAFSDDPLTARLEALIPAPVRGRAAPSGAAKAVASGIERRAARTIYPRAYLPLYALRGIAGPLADAAITHLPSVQRLLAEVRERDHQQAAARSKVAT